MRNVTLWLVSICAGLAAVNCSRSDGPDIGVPGGSGGFGFPGGSGGFDTCINGGPSGGTAIPSPGPGFPGSTTFAPPQFGTTVTLEAAPPAINGGTLLVLHDGHTAMASDPDRDRVSIVDLVARTVKATVPLSPGDEPGRLVEDAAGRVHVVLRRGGAVISLQPPAFTVSDHQAVCPAPRGLAYDAKADRVHVACAGGELVSLPAAGGAPVRSLTLDSDLRDVVVDGDGLLISRFRSAQILTVTAAGAISERRSPPSSQSPEARGNQLFASAVGWRMTGMPGGGVVMVHQRGMVDEVSPQAGGYGSQSPCDAIVQTALMVMKDGQMPKAAPAIPGMVLPVDVAVSPNGARVAIIAAGNATNSASPAGPPALPRVFAADIADVSDPSVGCRPDGRYGPCMADIGGAGGFAVGAFGSGGVPGTGGSGVGEATGSGGATGTGSAAVDGGAAFDAGAPVSLCPPNGAPAGEVPAVVGEPIALAYEGGGKVVVQTREPAALLLDGGAAIALGGDSREDTGHTVFHSNAGAFVACASCHPGGAEDGRVWNFACEGARRTQSLSAGISGTEPFHWNGNLKSFSDLMQNVFIQRMSGPKLVPDQMTAVLHWIDHQPPTAKAAPADPAAVERGRALFNDQKIACATCHAGDKLTNNMNADVGTRGMFQVPSLLGVSTRPPFMHDGCAATLSDRFTNAACGGGDRHGVTSTLAPARIADLVAYLETL